MPTERARAALIGFLERAGSHPAHNHAILQVGYVITDATRGHFTAAEVDAWLAAVAAYQAAHPETPPAPGFWPQPVAAKKATP